MSTPENSHGLKYDPSALQYRINFVTIEGAFLISTEFTHKRDVIVYLADTFNSYKKGIRASVETKAMGRAVA